MVFQKLHIDSGAYSASIAGKLAVLYENMLQALFRRHSVFYDQREGEGGVDVQGSACIGDAEFKGAVANG